MKQRRNHPAPDLDTTLERDTDLDELSDGGPTRSSGLQTGTVGGKRSRDATAGRKPQAGAGPTTTGDATTGGMNTPTEMSTSDANSTGQVGGAPPAGSDTRPDRRRDEPSGS